MIKIYHCQKYKGIRARLLALSATKGNLINKGGNNKVCQDGLKVCNCGIIGFYITE
ncbi:MAG: hypothetical protein LBL39_08420 [Planctomycetaceae bacterium]|nr:hypothetical protein [Planctomycetaceae bacterium]